MNDIIKINTNDGIIKDEKIMPLPIYDKTFPLLKVNISSQTNVKEYYNTPVMNNIIKRMKFTRKLYGALGLSANQVGLSHRLFVIGTDDFEMVCIEPEILKSSNEKTKDNEGCVSFPGLYLKIPRYTWIDVSFYDENLDYKELHFDGITARIIQHEMDHLNGINFTSLVGNVSLNLALKKQSKLLNKYRKNKNLLSKV